MDRIHTTQIGTIGELP